MAASREVSFMENLLSGLAANVLTLAVGGVIFMNYLLFREYVFT